MKGNFKDKQTSMIDDTLKSKKVIDHPLYQNRAHFNKLMDIKKDLQHCYDS